MGVRFWVGVFFRGVSTFKVWGFFWKGCNLKTGFYFLGFMLIGVGTVWGSYRYFKKYFFIFLCGVKILPIFVVEIRL